MKEFIKYIKNRSFKLDFESNYAILGILVLPVIAVLSFNCFVVVTIVYCIVGLLLIDYKKHKKEVAEIKKFLS